jgi:hypothetical protein
MGAGFNAEHRGFGDLDPLLVSEGFGRHDNRTVVIICRWTV